MSDSKGKGRDDDKGGDKKKVKVSEKDKKFASKVVESGLRFKLGGGGLRGSIEALPSLIKAAKIAGTMSSIDASAERKRNSDLSKVHKKLGEHASAVFKENEDALKEANLSLRKPPKIVPITEKNTKKSFAVLENWMLLYIKTKRKLEKAQSKAKAGGNRE